MPSRDGIYSNDDDVDDAASHFYSSQAREKRVADAMPNNKTGTFASCRHAFLFPPLRNVLRRSKVLRPTKLKRIMILNFHFVLILRLRDEKFKPPPTMSREVFCQLFEVGPFVSEFNNTVPELSLLRNIIGQCNVGALMPLDGFLYAGTNV